MNLSEFLLKIKEHPDFGQALVHYRRIPPVEAQYGQDPGLSAELSRTLEISGIKELYTHQVEAINYIKEGRNVIIATPTASGKSLIYNLTVIETLLKKWKMILKE